MIIILIVLSLAVYNCSRFITKSTHPIIGIPREKFVQRWAAYDQGPDGLKPDQKTSITGKPTNLFMRSVAYLWECHWCMSFFVSATLTSGTTLFTSVPLPWLMWLAASALATLLSELESD